MKYAFIVAQLMAYPLSVVCWVLGVTQSGLHAWRKRPPSKRAQERDRLSADIRRAYEASAEVRRWLAERGLRQSMSGTGNCYDNAPMESFWHSLKVEETHGQDFATRAQAQRCVFAYIEGSYNTTRMHSSLGYQSPTQFERACHLQSIKAANDTPINKNTNYSPSARLAKRAA